jgi:hypothetical protein
MSESQLLNPFMTAVKNFGGKAGFFLKQNQPQIMIGLGIVGFGASVILAYNAREKIEDALEKKDKALDDIADLNEADPELYTDEMRSRDAISIWGKTGIEIGKVVLPIASTFAISTALIFGSYSEMKTRQVGMMAAYKVIEETLNKYRANVVREMGEEKDIQFRYGVREESYKETTTVDGKRKTKTHKVNVVGDEEDYIPDNPGDVKNNRINGDDYSDYARFFDSSSPQWVDNPENNRHFLQSQQAYLNQQLKMRRHLFLNEVYDALGFERTKAGQVVGWIYENPDGDGYVDFGIYDSFKRANRDFVNGYEPVILLDFNVDGPIYDKI